MGLVSEGVHRLPESLMKIGPHPALAREPLHGPALPDSRLAVDVVDHFRRQHEETAIDPASIAVWLFLEAGDLVSLEVQCAETARGLYRRECGPSTLVSMVLNQPADVHIAHTVPVSEAERVLANVGRYGLQTAARHRCLARIN